MTSSGSRMRETRDEPMRSMPMLAATLPAFLVEVPLAATSDIGAITARSTLG